MPANIGLQISLELSKILPIKSIVDTMGSQILKLARDLRLSGSDLIVEEDLAEVFGRGRINPELEAKFRDVVKVHNFVPLSHGCEISLESGPGPTMLRAFRDKRYFAMVIQLSLFAWMHSREDLASMLSQAMTERFEMGVREASPGPGIEGIMSTLAACSSQSSDFSWTYYVQQVESRFRESMTNYSYHLRYLRLTRSLLLAAMDYLYLVQRFPEDRKITVSNEIGCITLIIWAHYVLGLTVAVAVPVSDTKISFGNDEIPHMIITWEAIQEGNRIQWLSDYCLTVGPEVRLLDSKMSVVLEIIPEAEERFPIYSEERHPLANYGVTYLQRSFNTVVITNDDDPIYVKAATLATALAICVDRRLDRQIPERALVDGRFVNRDPEIPDRPLPAASVEIWRILASARLIFADIPLQTAKLDSYVKCLSETVLNYESFSTIDAFLEKVPIDDWNDYPAGHPFSAIQQLAIVVLIFAHVSEVESCADLPITFIEPTGIRFRMHMNTTPNVRKVVDSREIFSTLAQFLVGKNSLEEHQSKGQEGPALFLYSEFGWSLFLDTVGDKDPALVRPELVHIKKGTPTNLKTKERKLRIRDGRGILGFPPETYPLLRGLEYCPRLAARVHPFTGRREYWASRPQEFEATIFLSVEPSLEWRQHPGVVKWQESIWYGALAEVIWSLHVTPHCDHPRVSEPGPTKLGPDAVALLGFDCIYERREGTKNDSPERIVIYLSRGDANIRWLAIRNAVRGRAPPISREVMLRRDSCCDACALEHTASRPGKWTLIL